MDPHVQQEIGFPNNQRYLPSFLSSFLPSLFHFLCPSFCTEFSFVTCSLSLIWTTVVPHHWPRGSASTSSFWRLDSGSAFSSHHTLISSMHTDDPKKLLERKVGVARGYKLRFCLQIHWPKKYLFAATRCGCHSAVLSFRGLSISRSVALALLGGRNNLKVFSSWLAPQCRESHN